MALVVTQKEVAVHQDGETDCNEGWCSHSDGTPVPYPHDCGGVVHGDFMEQDDQSWTVQTECDYCHMKEIIAHVPHAAFEHGKALDHRKVTVKQHTDPPHPVKPKPKKKAAK